MDAAQDDDPVPHGPAGYLGLSMGTRFGVPLIAAEPRITAAVLRLFGTTAAGSESDFARAARQVTVPVLSSSSGTTSCSAEATASPCLSSRWLQART
jgi:hypothetical protein